MGVWSSRLAEDSLFGTVAAGINGRIACNSGRWKRFGTRADRAWCTRHCAHAAIRFCRRWFGCRGCLRRSTERQFLGAMAVGEEADITDAVEPVRHGVQQEPAGEFVGVERHDFGLVAPMQAVSLGPFPGLSQCPNAGPLGECHVSSRAARRLDDARDRSPLLDAMTRAAAAIDLPVFAYLGRTAPDSPHD
jgi:hypothetical protein